MPTLCTNGEIIPDVQRPASPGTTPTVFPKALDGKSVHPPIDSTHQLLTPDHLPGLPRTNPMAPRILPGLCPGLSGDAAGMPACRSCCNSATGGSSSWGGVWLMEQGGRCCGGFCPHSDPLLLGERTIRCTVAMIPAPHTLLLREEIRFLPRCHDMAMRHHRF
jgi:hypothetical protein